MYPRRELEVLARSKQRLRERIHRQRGEAAAAVVRVIAPLQWIDRVRQMLRRETGG